MGFILFARVCLGFAVVGLSVSLNTWSSFRESSGPLLTLGSTLGLSAICDLLIALISMYYLYQGRTGFNTPYENSMTAFGLIPDVHSTVLTVFSKL